MPENVSPSSPPSLPDDLPILSFLASIFLLFAILLLTGCIAVGRSIGRAAIAGPSQAKEEFVGNPVALATVKTVVVLPFDCCAREPGFDAIDFATRLANQIASRGKLRVIYPREAIALAVKENRRADRHNAVLQQRELVEGIPPERVEGEGRPFFEGGEEGKEDRTLKPRLYPIQKIEDAVKLGCMLKADAVITGVVTDFDPYYRPRLSLLMRVVATGQSDAAAIALAELTQWGVPRRSETARGILWYLQQNFDSRDGDIGRNVAVYSVTKHTEHHPYDTDAYLRSISLYYDYVSAVLSHTLHNARQRAIQEAEERALREAEKMRISHEAVRRRIRELVSPTPHLPDADAILAENLYDRRNRSWRPDVYNLQHPRKKAILDATSTDGKTPTPPPAKAQTNDHLPPW